MISKKTVFFLLAVFILAISLPVCAAERHPLPRVGLTHDFVWTKDEDIPELIKALKESGSQAVRMPIRWTVLEREKGIWDFSRVDKIIRLLRDEGFEILAVLTSVPAWASGVDPANTPGFWDMTPPQNVNDWAEFVRRCAGRYKKHISHWEIWNEQDGIDWFKPEPNAGKYVQLLKASYKAAKKANSNAVVVLGSLQMNGIIANPWSDYKNPGFLQKLYDCGAKPYFDVVNIHPYVLPTPDQGAAYCVNLVRDTVRVMRRNGDGNKPLWVTETGTPITKELTEQMQADHLKAIYEELGKIPEVKLIYWFCLKDYASDLTGGEDTMGLLNIKNRRKAAFDSFRNVAERYRGVTVYTKPNK